MLSCRPRFALFRHFRNLHSFPMRVPRHLYGDRALFLLIFCSKEHTNASQTLHESNLPSLDFSSQSPALQEKLIDEIASHILNSHSELSQRMHPLLSRLLHRLSRSPQPLAPLAPVGLAEPRVISDEEISQLPRAVFRGDIIVVDRTIDVEEALEQLRDVDILGFDTETKPMARFRKGRNKVASLQLSSENVAVIFRLCKMRCVPTPLKQFLRKFDAREVPLDTPRWMVGQSPLSDLRDLKEDYGVCTEHICDLVPLAQRLNVLPLRLTGLAGTFLRHRVVKSEQMSDWEADQLTVSQQQYAALDAWLCREIFIRMKDELSKTLDSTELNRVIRQSAFAHRHSAPFHYRRSTWPFGKTPLSALNEWVQQHKYASPLLTVDERMPGQFFARVGVPEISASFCETTDPASSKDEAKQNAALLFLLEHKLWPFR